MKIYLCRHGETTGDLEDRYGGDYEDSLTQNGKSQAKDLAEKLSDKNIEIIISSPRIRAQETADILSGTLGVSNDTVQDLRERNAYGVLTGLTKTAAEQYYPDEVLALVDYESNITGAEIYDDFKTRVMNIFSKIERRDNKTIAIVTHGGVIRCFVREILKLGELNKLGDCAILELDYDDKYDLINISNAELVNKNT